MYFKESVADNKDKPKKLWGLFRWQESWPFSDNNTKIL